MPHGYSFNVRIDDLSAGTDGQRCMVAGTEGNFNSLYVFKRDSIFAQQALLTKHLIDEKGYNIAQNNVLKELKENDYVAVFHRHP
ncbi:MAG: hypothetical protein KKF44_11535 [Nanoarchaeota archaeon]|nr:hypothetical protein [Nanoarchaeota archaeon]